MASLWVQYEAFLAVPGAGSLLVPPETPSGPSFSAHTYAAAVKKIETWAENGNSILTGVRLEFFDETIKSFGSLNGGETSAHTFALDEELVEAVEIGTKDNARVAYISIKTTKTHFISSITKPSNGIVYHTLPVASTGQFFLGFFGSATSSQVNQIGAYSTKPIQYATVSNAHFPTDLLEQPSPCSTTGNVVEVISETITNYDSNIPKEETIEYSIGKGQRHCYGSPLGLSARVGDNNKIPVVEINDPGPGVDNPLSWGYSIADPGAPNCEPLGTVDHTVTVIVPAGESCSYKVFQCQPKLVNLEYTADFELTFHDGTKHSLEGLSGRYSSTHTRQHTVISTCDFFKGHDDGLNVMYVVAGVGCVLAVAMAMALWARRKGGGGVQKGKKKKKKGEKKGKKGGWGGGGGDDHSRWSVIRN